MGYKMTMMQKTILKIDFSEKQKHSFRLKILLPVWSNVGTVKHDVRVGTR